MLGLADHAPGAAPAVQGGVEELLEAPGRLAGLGMLGGRDGQVGFELGDQAPIAREAEDIVDAIHLAPGHQLVPSKARIGTQQDLDPRPGRAEPLDDAGHLSHGAGRGVDVRGPQQGGKQVPTAEDVQGQITVATIVAVEEPPLLLSVQGVVGGIQVEDDLLRRPLLGFEEQIDQQIGERLGVVVDLVVAVIGSQRRVLQAIERALAGERRAVGPLRLQSVGEQREHRVVAQLVVVVHVLVTQGDAHDPLPDQGRQGVHHLAVLATIHKACGDPLGQAERALGLTQQQPTAIGGHGAAIERRHHPKPSNSNCSALHSVRIGPRARI